MMNMLSCLTVWTAVLLGLTATSVTADPYDCALVSDKVSCLDALDDDANHCAWCLLTAKTDAESSTSSFCVSEGQAASSEALLPGIACFRYSEADDDGAAPDEDDDDPIDDDGGDEPTDDYPIDDEAIDDDAEATDDAEPATDDAEPATDDDEQPATDDSTPEDDDSNEPLVFRCLEMSDEDACQEKDGCSWCVSAIGDKLCLETDFSADADYYTCTESTSTTATSTATSLMGFTCTVSATSEDACLETKDDDGTDCVWCAFSTVGLCLSEAQSETAESTVPGVACTRHKDSDDDAAPTDDAAPEDDDAAPLVFQCLKLTEADACHDKDGCSWCVSKIGNALCLETDFANDTAYYTCDADDYFAMEDPYDPSCVMAYLETPTQEGCTSAVDQDGNPCEWCDMAGMAQLCLNAEQAEAGTALGVTCDETVAVASVVAVEDPMDPSCALAFLQDPTEEGCTSSVDSDGNPCEWCDLSGVAQLCLNADQAEAGQAFGVTCDTAATVSVEDPMDPSCALAFLQDPTEEGCTSSVDSDGNPCEWCDLSGVAQLCLNADQAEAGQAFGVTCDTVFAETQVEDPMDPSCALAFLQDPTEDGCTSSVDSDGNPCEWCDLSGVAQLCLNADQAEAGQAFGVTCDTTTQVEDPMDPSCALAFLQDPTEDGCTSSVDSDGNPCEWCDLSGVAQLCLNADQAEAGQAFGVTCDTAAVEVEDPMDPSCALAFLQDPTEDGCTSSVDSDGNPCEWCDLSGVAQLCLNADQAEAGQAFGVTCDSATVSVEDPMDPSCALAFLQDPTEEGCTSSVDSDGNPCEWCDLSGVAQLCLNADQAEAGQAFGVTCDSKKLPVAVDGPYDITCMMSVLVDPTKKGCKATKDMEGAPCEFCTLDSLHMCLTPEQADMGAQGGIVCEEPDVVQSGAIDMSCFKAMAEPGDAVDNCSAGVDADGARCKSCMLPTHETVCLTAVQANAAGDFGVVCVTDEDDEAALVSIDEESASGVEDFWECLEHYQEHDCNQSGCTWCNSQPGMGFCLIDGAANALKDCPFFDCDYKEAAATPADEIASPMDPVCLAAGMNSDDAASVCKDTADSDGNPCVWCDAAGVFGLCMSREGADEAGKYLNCDTVAAAVVV